jgi:3-deoxy-D-manno-octulosonic-acid transferase
MRSSPATQRFFSGTFEESMTLFLYNLLLLLVAVLASPWWLLRLFSTQKYREGLSQRLGIRLPAHLDSASGKKTLWIHAVSVGEVQAVLRLVRELEAALPNVRVLLSTTTRTGQQLAQQRLGAARVFYFPLDLPFSVHRLVNYLQPSLLVLAETEFWPNMLSTCRRRGIPVVVVNARISDRSWPRYRLIRRYAEPYLANLAAVLAQSNLDRDRLLALGCRNVSVSGNLKFDVANGSPSEIVATIRKALPPAARVIVAGSTVAGEEPILLDAWAEVVATEPRALLILAPRHPERFDEVARLLSQSGFSWQRRSLWAVDPTPLAAGSVLLLDSIGELSSVYSLGTVAFVGGSLVPAGGHNPLEPAIYSIPVVMGPYGNNFREIITQMTAAEALTVLCQEDSLAPTLLALLSNPAIASYQGTRAKELCNQLAGATARSVEVIRIIFPRGAAQ